MASNAIRVALLATATLVWTATLNAQNALYAVYQDKLHLVRRVERHTAYVDDGAGKLVAAREGRYALEHAPEFLPLYVSVRNVQVRTSSVELLNSGDEINLSFSFRICIGSGPPMAIPTADQKWRSDRVVGRVAVHVRPDRAAAKRRITRAPASVPAA